MRLRCIALVVLLAAPAAAAADDFADFRIPPHHEIGWSARLSANGYRTKAYDDFGTNHVRNAQAGSSSGFSWLADSDPTTTRVSVAGSASVAGAWQARSSAYSGAFTQDDEVIHHGFEIWSLSALHRRYPWAVPLGLSVAVVGFGSYSQNWLRSNSLERIDSGGGAFGQVDRASFESWQYDHSVSSDVGLGVGRVRDATPVYDAQVLESRLRAAGAITRPLSPEARRRLAALVALRGSYRGVHERQTKYLWRQIENLLERDGALAEGGLEGYALLRAGEPHQGPGLTNDVVPQSPVARLTGGIVEAIYSDRHRRRLLRSDVSAFSQASINDTLQPPYSQVAHDRRSDTVDEGLGGAQAEYHRPLGARWQADFASRLLFPLRKEIDGFELTTQGDLTMLVEDRWTATAFATQYRAVRRRGADGITELDDWGWSYGLQATYYFEDRLGLRASVVENQARGRSDLSYPAHTSGFHNASFQLDLTYRFLGRFDSGGLFPPETIAGPR